MIYTLTNTIRNQTAWQDIVYEQDYLDIVNLHHNTDMNKFSHIGEFFQNNFSKIEMLTEDDVLLIDDSYLLLTHDTIFAKDIIKKLNKLSCKCIVISKNNIITEELNSDNVFIFSPAVYNSYTGLLLNNYNPGLIYSSHGKSYHVINKILNEFKDIPKYKKFNFIHNELTSNSCYIFFLMNKFGILKDTFYTNPKLHSDAKITPNNHMYNYQNVLISAFGEDVGNRIPSDDYYKFINSLPNDSLQMEWNDRIETMSPFNLSSYVSIIAPDLCNNDNYQYISNNIFRPFLWKNIPLFIGSSHTYSIVKNYGFDLFEDIFDLPSENIRGLDRVNNLFENIQLINKKSHSELHDLYNSVNHRLDSNFNLLRKLGDRHINHLINSIIKK